MRPDSANIQLIIDGCVKGVPAAQKRLFQLKYGLVMSICRRYATGADEAKEMLNDTFYTAFKYINKYDTDRPLVPWLSKLCVNCCLQHMRKYSSKETFVELTNDNQLDNEDTPLDDYVFPESPHYMKLIAQLSKAYKTVLNLYVIEEYKHQEIAKILGISVGTSKSNLFRAKRLLYDMLEKDSRFILKLKNDG